MKPVITVVPLGPGAPEMLTLGSAELLQSSAYRLILRTNRHPVADWLREKNILFESMDDFYDRFEDFDDMHAAMASWLWQEAADSNIALGVMDPIHDGLVSALRNQIPEKASISVLPGVTASSLCLTSLPAKVNHGGGLQVFSATDFLSAPYSPETDLLITEIDSAILAGEVKLKLLDLLSDEKEILFFPPSSLASRPTETVPLYLLDSRKSYNHTAAAFIPGSDYLARARYTFEDLSRITSRLRAPDGCPWDRVQTHESLRPFMVEEAWEAVNAIDAEDMDHLADELGDVLFQVFIHASIGQSFDEFTMTDVLTNICRKMISRHPHVFGASHGESAEEISQGWESRKRQETGSHTVGETLNDVSQALPALKYSIKMYKKLAQLPALRRSPEVIAREIQRFAADLFPASGGTDSKFTFEPTMIGELLMKITELCYLEDQDAEILLHAGVEHMKRRYQEAEKMIFQEKKAPENLTIQQLCVYLEAAEGRI